MSTTEIIETIATDGTLRDAPIVTFVADLVSRMGWDATNFDARTENGYAMIVLYNDAGDSTSFCLSGYNYAYQVLLVMQGLKQIGYFD